jgi:hypothetical protein
MRDYSLWVTLFGPVDLDASPAGPLGAAFWWNLLLVPAEAASSCRGGSFG